MEKTAFVNIAANFSHAGGFGTHARCFANALNGLERIARLDSGMDFREIDASIREVADTRPTIWIGPPSAPAALPGNPKIGWITWETTRVPAPYRDALTSFDILWAPSTFTKGVLDDALGGSRPVHVVPEGVDTEIFRPSGLSPNCAGRKPFRFLAVGKWEPRKAHDYLIRAYQEAFEGQSDVELIIRLTSSNKDSEIALPRCNGTLPKITFVPKCSQHDLADLYRSADAFVSATRGESWGLPILEAMATGLPCIVTDYGGHLDYCNADNSFLVPTNGLVPVEDPIYFPGIHDWGLWAEPSINGIAQTLRAVILDREKALQRGASARHTARSRWTWEHSAQVAQKYLRSYA